MIEPQRRYDTRTLGGVARADALRGMMETQREPAWRAKANEILGGLRSRSQELLASFGETGVDIMKGNLANLVYPDVVEILTLIGLSRSFSLGSRFVGDMELTREPGRILRILRPGADLDSAAVRYLGIWDVQKAVGEDRLRISYDTAAERLRKATLTEERAIDASAVSENGHLPMPTAPVLATAPSKTYMPKSRDWAEINKLYEPPY